MIGASRTGEVAGSVYAQNHPHLTINEQRQAAILALRERQAQGIAHCWPESEFIEGFMTGFRYPTLTPDGLQLAVSLARP